MTNRTVSLEQYFTTDKLVDKCVYVIQSLYDFDKFDLIVEPSAGDGAFLNRLPHQSTLAIDIEPRHPSIEKADFLSWKPQKVGRILTVGNPPFGIRASLATKFLLHACEFSEVVAFILPRSYKKYTMQERVPRNFHLVEEFECQDFRKPNGTPIKVPCVFQIWEKRDALREEEKQETSHPDFEMYHRHMSKTTEEERRKLREDYHFTIPQVGTNFSPRDVNSVSTGSHFFIRTKSPQVTELFYKLDFSFLNGTFTRLASLSKKDIVRAYKEVLARNERP